jgi:hypothetical protein
LLGFHHGLRRVQEQLIVFRHGDQRAIDHEDHSNVVTAAQTISPTLAEKYRT